MCLCVTYDKKFMFLGDVSGTKTACTERFRYVKERGGGMGGTSIVHDKQLHCAAD